MCRPAATTNATAGTHVTGNTAGSRTVQEFTILTKRFEECYPEFAGTGSDTYQAEDGSALTDRDSCYKPYESNGHRKRAHTKNGQPWCQEAFLGSFYFTFGDVDQDRVYPDIQSNGVVTGKEGREKLIALSSPAAVFVPATAKSEGGVEHFWVDANGDRCDEDAEFVDNDNDPTTPPEEKGTCAGGAKPVGYLMTPQRGDTVAATDPGGNNGGNLGGTHAAQKDVQKQGRNGVYRKLQ